MRTKREIKTVARGVYDHPEKPIAMMTMMGLQLEVLLDIRELLQRSTEKPKVTYPESAIPPEVR